ncbi:MAG: hypothetical protein U5K76_15190 [Woeseiaceae bacterium]|nr:hypothetical protein [Woeseiaceae bacterium]
MAEVDWHCRFDAANRKPGMTIENESDLEGLRAIGRIVARVLRDLCSHGTGRALHESPAAIPGFYDPRDRRVLHVGAARR